MGSSSQISLLCTLLTLGVEDVGEPSLPILRRWVLPMDLNPWENSTEELKTSAVLSVEEATEKSINLTSPHQELGNSKFRKLLKTRALDQTLTRTPLVSFRPSIHVLTWFRFTKKSSENISFPSVQSQEKERELFELQI